MSLEDVVAFWRTVQTDAALQEQLAANAASADADRCVATAGIARQAGFTVTATEVKDVGSVVAFWQRVAENPVLQEAIAPAQQAGSFKAASLTIARVAGDAGFTIPPEALSSVTTALVESDMQRDVELSDSDLDHVSGGAQSPSALTSVVTAARNGTLDKLMRIDLEAVCSKL